MTTTSPAAPALRTPIVLSATAFVVAWEKLGLGALPRALFVPSPSATHADRARIEHLAATELSRLGIGAGDAVDHELAATLRLLARPAAECYGWVVPAGGRTFSLLAAASGRYAVLATLDVPVLELSPVDPLDLAMAIAHHLPPVPPADAPLPIADYTRPCFEHAAGVPIAGNGQVFVAVRDRLARRRQHGHAIEYVDTTRGRWLLRPGNPASAIPATADIIAAELTAARHQLITEPRSHR